MDRQRVLTLLLVFALLGSLSVGAGFYHRAEALEHENAALREEVHTLRDGSSAPEGALATKYGATVDIIAYSSVTGRARLLPARVGHVPGSGVYLDVGDAALRDGAQNAVKSSYAAYTTAGVSAPYGAGVVEVEIPEAWDYLAGESGGLPLAVAFIAAAAPSLAVNESVAMTGKVRPDGTIAPVSEVAAKARAARDAGKSMLLVPAGQAVSVDGVRIVEVDTVTEAVELATIQENKPKNGDV